MKKQIIIGVAIALITSLTTYFIVDYKSSAVNETIQNFNIRQIDNKIKIVDSMQIVKNKGLNARMTKYIDTNTKQHSKLQDNLDSIKNDVSHTREDIAELKGLVKGFLNHLNIAYED